MHKDGFTLAQEKTGPATMTAHDEKDDIAIIKAQDAGCMG